VEGGNRWEREGGVEGVKAGREKRGLTEKRKRKSTLQKKVSGFSVSRPGRLSYQTFPGQEYSWKI